MDDTDKEPASNLCGHGGSFVLLKTHKPVPSLWGQSHKDGWTKPLGGIPQDQLWWLAEFRTREKVC